MAPPVEITIPSTSLQTPSDGGKPYTLYNITLRLPLRTFVVQKRYSEFAALHQSLQSLTGDPPPAPLPGKSWFRSTVSSPEMTENRRRGLENYLRAIAESPDKRWRDTPAWRTFLNLPGINSSGNSVTSMRAGAGFGLPNSDAAKAAAAQDPITWLDLHRELKNLLKEARQCLARRDAATDNNTALEAGGAAKRALIKAGGLIVTLAEGLRIMAESRRLMEGEVRRRKDILAAARVDREDLDKMSNSLAAQARASGAQAHAGMPTAADKAVLLGGHGGGPRTSGRVLGAPLPETERTRELDNTGVQQLQQQMMREQDEDIGDLAKIVQRQREMAMQIDEEVRRQLDMLDHVDQGVDRLQAKTDIAKKHIRKVAGG